MARPPRLLSVRSGRRSAAHPAEPAPVGQERTVATADGASLYVQEFGPQEAAGTVVLAHGYWQSSRLWAGQIRDLTAARPDLRVVAYDQPRGCAASYYPETNPLVPLDSTAEGSNCPTSKAVVVRLEPREDPR